MDTRTYVQQGDLVPSKKTASESKVLFISHIQYLHTYIIYNLYTYTTWKGSMAIATPMIVLVYHGPEKRKIHLLGRTRCAIDPGSLRCTSISKFPENGRDHIIHQGVLTDTDQSMSTGLVSLSKTASLTVEALVHFF